MTAVPNALWISTVLTLPHEASFLQQRVLIEMCNGSTGIEDAAVGSPEPISTFIKQSLYPITQVTERRGRKTVGARQPDNCYAIVSSRHDRDAVP